LQQQDTFQHFQGESQVPSLPMPAGAHVYYEEQSYRLSARRTFELIN